MEHLHTRQERDLRPAVDPLWQAFVLAMAGTYAVWTIFHVLLGAIWSRWFTRRTDRALVEVVGREQVVQWLKRHADAPRSASRRGWFRRLSDGLPPDPAERLRMLEKG